MTKLREDIVTLRLSPTLTTVKQPSLTNYWKQSETLDARTELAERAMDSNDIERAWNYYPC